MTRTCIKLLLAASLCLGATTTVFADNHEGGDRPPMLALMPPPDMEKPEGVEMTGDPEQDFQMLFDVFFRMMDQDSSGELNMDELRGWVHPPPMGPGPGMDGDHDGQMGDGQMGDGQMHDGGMGEHDGMMGDGDMAEKVRRLEEELRRVREEQHKRHMDEMRNHRERLVEQIRHAREEQQRIADHLRQMEEDARRLEEEMQKPPMEPMQGEG